MGLFDMFNKVVSSKKQNTTSEFNEILVPERVEPAPPFISTGKEQNLSNGYEAFYKNGVLYDVNPRNKAISLDEDRQVAYDAQYIILNNIKYNLEDANSIACIVIPNFEDVTGSMPYPTRDLSYILRMRAGRETRPNLAVPLVYKTANMMLASPISWHKKDFFRLVIQLWSIGEFAYGDNLLEQLNRRIPSIMSDDETRNIKRQNFEQNLTIAKQLNEDYLISDYYMCPCEKCAPFRGRVFNISGKDKRFPKLSDYVLFPEDLCCIMFFGFYYYEGVTITKYYYDENNNVKEKEMDAIIYSNRPFIDDRSTLEKQKYLEWKEKEEKKAKQDRQYYNRQTWIEKYNCRFEYYQVKTKLGEKAPKSFDGYMRMKRNNTENYKKIEALARQLGIKIQELEQ